MITKNKLNSSDESVVILLEHYLDLVEHTKSILFPWWSIKVIEAPNLQGMKKWQAMLADLLAPYLIPNAVPFSGSIKGLAYYLWLFLFFVWSSLILAFLNLTSQQPQNSVPVSALPTLLEWIIAVMLFFIPPILVYSYTIWFLITKRNPWKNRALWVTLLVVFLYCIFIQMKTVDPSEISAIVTDPIYKPILFLIVFPAIIFINFNTMYYGKAFIELIVNSFRSFFAAHQSISYQVLRKVTTIGVKSDWSLSDLEIIEIEALGELAKNNLESTEKKTIPVAISIALIGLVAQFPVTQQFFGDIIQRFISSIIGFFFSGNTSSITLGLILFNLSIVLILVLTMSVYLVLFRNLIIQGIVIQACTIAKYAKKKDMDQNFKKHETISTNTNIFTPLIEYITSFFRQKP